VKIGVLAGIVMLVVAASGGVIFVQADAAVQQSTEERLTGNARMQAETVGEWNERMKDQVSVLARAPDLGEDPSEARRYLNDRIWQLPEYVVGIHVVDRESTEVLASTETGAEGEDLGAAGVPWAEDGVSAPAGEPLRTAPYHDPVFDAPAVGYTLQVEAASDRTLVLVVDLGARSGALAAASNDIRTVVVDNSGRVVLSHETGDIGDQHVAGEGVESEAVSAGMIRDVGYVEVERDGTTMAVGYAPVPGAN
jgi:methyl-accepting chemotaxis protein